MKDCQCYAEAIDPERQDMWKRVFPPDGKVPISPPLPYRGNLSGQDSLFYLVDLDRVTPLQRETLIQEMSTRFNLLPDDVVRDIDEQGVPVKADGVIATWCRQHSRAAM